MKPKQLQPSRGGHLHCLVSVLLHTQTSLISQDFIKETSLLILLLLLLWSSVNLCTCSMNTVSKTILTVLIVLALSDQDAHDSVNRAHRRPKDRMLKKRSNCLFQNVTALVSTVQTNSCPIQPSVFLDEMWDSLPDWEPDLSFHWMFLHLIWFCRSFLNRSSLWAAERKRFKCQLVKNINI